MVKIAITGISGRMGRTIATCVEDEEGAILAGAIEKEGHPWVGRGLQELTGLNTDVVVTDNPEEAFRDADVVIDFTTPEATIRNLEIAVALQKPVVIGTTGFSVEQRATITEASRRVGVVFAPNMSIGVNLLFRLVTEAARILGDEYDVEIVEYHHRHKKDAPSGTALRIAELIAHTLGRDLDKVAVYGRKGITGERTTEEIGIQSVRAGDIVGDHIVLFAGSGERLELTHRAHSRTTFARGAVKAALWLVDRDTGLYDMQDVLGLR